jgi:hypothetical protein
MKIEMYKGVKTATMILEGDNELIKMILSKLEDERDVAGSQIFDFEIIDN